MKTALVLVAVLLVGAAALALQASQTTTPTDTQTESAAARPAPSLHPLPSGSTHMTFERSAARPADDRHPHHVALHRLLLDHGFLPRGVQRPGFPAGQSIGNQHGPWHMPTIPSPTASFHVSPTGGHFARLPAIGYKDGSWHTTTTTGPADIPTASPRANSIARWRSGWG